MLTNKECNNKEFLKDFLDIEKTKKKFTTKELKDIYEEQYKE